MSTIIIPTLRAEHLVKNLKLPKGYEVVLPLGNKEGQRFFPDDEVYVRLPDEIMDFEGRVVVLHSGMPHPNKGIVELEMILKILSKTSAKVEVFFAYFPYCMQDNVEFKGDTNAAEDLVVKLTKFYGVKKVYILDAHFFGKEWVKKYPIKTIPIDDTLKKIAIAKYGKKIVFMGPDAGSQMRANVSGTTKKRKNSFEVDISHDDDFKMCVKGKVVGVIDDLVETGGTLSKFADVCRGCGAKDVVALITHGVLVSGVKRVKSSYSDLFLSNSIDREDASVDISSIIMKEITKK